MSQDTLNEDQVDTEAPEISPVELEELISESERGAPPGDNLGRVLDVAVPLTARVGMVRKTISDILDLSPGAVIDLERSSGEPIDLVIGDKLIAKGEIVVVDDRYGVRVVEVVQEP